MSSMTPQFECPMLLVKRHTPAGADIMGDIVYFLSDGVHLPSPSSQSTGLMDALSPLNGAMIEQFSGLRWSVSMVPGYGLQRGDHTFDELVSIPDLLSILEPYSALLTVNPRVKYDCMVELGVMPASAGRPLRVNFRIYQVVPESARVPEDLAYIVRNEFAVEYARFDSEAPELDSVRTFYTGAFSGCMNLLWSFETKGFVHSDENVSQGKK